MKQFLIAAVVMLIIDSVWLGLIANKLYKRQLGPLLRDKPDFVAAAAFYLVYILTLTILVTVPAANDGASTGVALWKGAVFGLAAYGTYDLTNASTLKNWPKLLTLVDIAWGIVLTAAVAAITVALS